MTTVVERAELLTRDLDPTESRRFFDAKAQEILGISGEEFLRRWAAGAYAEVADGPAHSDIMYLLLLGTGGR